MMAATTKEAPMASLTIPDLDDFLKSRLRIQAAVHGRSVEEEARDIIRDALTREADEPNRLGTAIHELFKPLGGLELPESIKQPIREPPDFRE
jgi:plasmid stability protein